MREVRFAGFLGGVSLIDEADATQITDQLIEMGFISRPLRGNTLQISPPFITTDDELSDYLGAIEETVTEAVK